VGKKGSPQESSRNGKQNLGSEKEWGKERRRHVREGASPRQRTLQRNAINLRPLEKNKNGRRGSLRISGGGDPKRESALVTYKTKTAENRENTAKGKLSGTVNR